MPSICEINNSVRVSVCDGLPLISTIHVCAREKNQFVIKFLSLDPCACFMQKAGFADMNRA
jgi:hypothetical protein